MKNELVRDSLTDVERRAYELVSPCHSTCHRNASYVEVDTVKSGFYSRYVDETFVIFGSERECDSFHVILNQLYSALNFY